ncbi:unnamed protein product, partial [marine sediment metagenome]
EAGSPPPQSAEVFYLYEMTPPRTTPLPFVPIVGRVKILNWL